MDENKPSVFPKENSNPTSDSRHHIQIEPENSKTCQIVAEGQNSRTVSRENPCKEEEFKCGDLTLEPHVIVSPGEKNFRQEYSYCSEEEQTTRGQSFCENHDEEVLIYHVDERITRSGEKEIIAEYIPSSEKVDLYSENIPTRQKPSNRPPPNAPPGYPYQGSGYPTQGSGYPTQGYGQTPYYQQQMVGGQPVYSPVPPPQDASRMPAVRSGQQQQQLASYGDADNGSSTDSLLVRSRFATKQIRNRFVQKVYTLLSVLLLISVGIISVCIFEPHCRQYLYGDTVIFWSSMGTYMVLAISLMCCKGLRRTVPLNFILLFLTAVSMSIFMGCLSTHYRTDTVLMTMAITAAISIMISIFACQTKIDTTGWGVYLYVIMMVLLAFGIAATIVYFVTGSGIMYLVYSGAAALFFCLYLVYDTQQIMGGRRFELSPEEYIVGTLSLYIDIMYIFVHLMSLIGYFRG